MVVHRACLPIVIYLFIFILAVGDINMMDMYPNFILFLLLLLFLHIYTKVREKFELVTSTLLGMIPTN
jgi:hypothetical protein